MPIWERIYPINRFPCKNQIETMYRVAKIVDDDFLQPDDPDRFGLDMQVIERGGRNSAIYMGKSLEALRKEVPGLWARMSTAAKVSFLHAYLESAKLYTLEILKTLGDLGLEVGKDGDDLCMAIGSAEEKVRRVISQADRKTYSLLLVLGKDGKFQKFPRARFHRLYSEFSGGVSVEALPEFANGPVCFVDGVVITKNSRIQGIRACPLRFYLNGEGRMEEDEHLKVMYRAVEKIPGLDGEPSSLPKDDWDFDEWEMTPEQKAEAGKMIRDWGEGKIQKSTT